MKLVKIIFIILYIIRIIIIFSIYDYLLVLSVPTIELPRIMLNVISYHRYSGEMREIGVTIDDTANVLWENVSLVISLIYHTAF